MCYVALFENVTEIKRNNDVQRKMVQSIQRNAVKRIIPEEAVEIKPITYR